MSLTNNKPVIDFVKEMKALANPDTVIWIDGSETQLEKLKAEACSTGELIRLNQEKLPGCYYHRSDKNDVARVEDRTFICCKDKNDAGPTNNWMAPNEAYIMAKGIFRDSMKGRTMYVVPFSMGPIGSPFAKVGIELTDSIYVVLNMAIMTRIGKPVLDMLGDSNDFVRAMHGKCNLDPQNRYILHFPEDNAIWSMNSGYGGNALLGKKCFALRMASYQGKTENWLAEHMLILGIQGTLGKVYYIAAAFPSACGKTNLAMMIPPEGYVKKGYKIWTVGDDIAWLRVGRDGRLWACNAESGFFGVAPGTSTKSNPNAMLAAKKDTIFTNVVLKDDLTVWWEGHDDEPPIGAADWKGDPWDPKSSARGAHPNARYTAPARNCPSISPHWEDLQGVPLTAIVFGGRRAKSAPLVYQARNWQHGVFVGSIMASETTAAQVGDVGVIRRDPMAMLPFCGYNMGDYWQHWLDMGKKIKNQPKIFNVNWFRLDDNGNFLWPGFSENFRVLDWITRRCVGEVNALDSPVGYVPNPDDIDIFGISYEISPGRKFDNDVLREILTIEPAFWKSDVDSIKDFYSKFGDKLPKEMTKELVKLEEKLGLQQKNIVMLATGGTIAGTADSSDEMVRYTPATVGIDALIESVPEMKSIANVTGEQIAQVDSKDMDNSIWLKLAKRVNELTADPDVTGIVITHGTDAMEETAYFLNLVVKSEKPVVLTGAMRPSTAISSDGKINLYNAVILAGSNDARGKGVVVAMNDTIHSAADVVKTNTFLTDAFRSPQLGALGYIHGNKAIFHKEALRRHTFNSRFDITNLNELPKVDIVYGYANASGLVIDALVQSGVHGIVYAGVGNGSIFSDAEKSLIDAQKAGVVVVRSSRVGSGMVTRNGAVDDDKLDFIASDILNPQKARVLLMLALTVTKCTAEIQRMFLEY